MDAEDDPLPLPDDETFAIDDVCAVCGNDHDDGDLIVPDEGCLNQCIRDMLKTADDPLMKKHNGPFGLYVKSLKEALQRANTVETLELVYHTKC